MGRPQPRLPDLTEYGANDQQLDRRLFVQVLCFGESVPTEHLIEDLDEAPFPAVLYEQLNDPEGVALVTWNEDPAFFTEELRCWLGEMSFSAGVFQPQLSMLGRTYALGHEQNLEDWLVHKPPRTLCGEAGEWAIWYPLRRAGAFEGLADEDKARIMREHAEIGMGFAMGGHGSDVRLACHGLDVNDNDFVIGLIGPQLHPLSAMVQTMRSTEQTSRYLERLGPFVVGRRVFASDLADD